MSTPFLKETRELGDEADLLDPHEATLFRAIAARANYLAQDRADIQFTVKEICAQMANPNREGWRRLKHLGCYLLGHPEVEYLYPWT